MKLKLPKMTVPLFNSSVIYLCSSEEEYIYACDKLKIPARNMLGINGVSLSFVDEVHGERLHLLCVLNFSISTLAHEAAHTAFRICDEVGVRVEADKANETYCYLLSRIVDFGIHHLRKQAEIHP